MKNKSQTVRIPKGQLWKSPHSFASDGKGMKTHLCWPDIDNPDWLKDLQDVLKAGDSPRFVTHQNGKFTWHFIRDCYHGGEGWWYRWDTDRNAPRTEEYRLFIPSKIEFHPDYVSNNAEEA